MFKVDQFAEDNLEVQHALIERHPLGLLIGNNADGRLNANPIPFSLVRDAGPFGVLRAHIARTNPQWSELEAASECLVVFQGEEAYVSPNWYPTKKVHGKVVPTWNYVTVHAWGVPTIIEDSSWILDQLNGLTDHQESEQARPWAVDDAPPKFTAAMVNAIVGIEVRITEIQGKWKVSQNRRSEDVQGVYVGLTASGQAEMAKQVAKHLDAQ
ncbi:MAG: FMN-binding negative transcriptional regulator [Pseudomonadota bacterium]